MKRKNKLTITINGRKIKKRFVLKKFLEDNKVYFETLMTISLTIMGVVVAIISLSIDNRTADIQKQQLELDKLAKLPVFNVVSQKHTEKYIIDGRVYSPCIEYEIINNGGNLTYAYLHTQGNIEMKFKYKDGKEFSISFENSQRFSKSYSYYNAERKSFTIRSDFDNRYIDLKNYLYEMINKDYDVKFTIDTVDYVNIQYSDIEGVFYNDWYELEGDILAKKHPNTPTVHKIMNINTMTNEEVYSEIQRILDEYVD